MAKALGRGVGPEVAVIKVALAGRLTARMLLLRIWVCLLLLDAGGEAGLALVRAAGLLLRREGPLLKLLLLLPAVRPGLLGQRHALLWALDT